MKRIALVGALVLFGVGGTWALAQSQKGEVDLARAEFELLKALGTNGVQTEPMTVNGITFDTPPRLVRLTRLSEIGVLRAYEWRGFCFVVEPKGMTMLAAPNSVCAPDR